MMCKCWAWNHYTTKAITMWHVGTDADAGVCCLQDVAIGFSLNKMSLYMAYRLE